MSHPLNFTVPSPADLPGGPLVVSTIGMAVRDLRTSMATLWATLGWGPWTVYRQAPPVLTYMRYRGSPARFSFLVAGTSRPGLAAFWLCQPLEGPSLYRELVEEGIPGPHFMTVWRNTEVESAELKAWFTSKGATELMSGRVEGSIEFTFLDTRQLCGLILETGSGRSTKQRIDSVYPPPPEGGGDS